MIPDAAKRRQLPAWIREGLEKMEREKQKKIDRERQIKEREEYLQKKREEEENAINELEKNSGQPVIPKKSKFVSLLVWWMLLVVLFLSFASSYFSFLATFLSWLSFPPLPLQDVPTYAFSHCVIFGFQSKKHC
jgi:hypothetical protein